MQDRVMFCLVSTQHGEVMGLPTRKSCSKRISTSHTRWNGSLRRSLSNSGQRSATVQTSSANGPRTTIHPHDSAAASLRAAICARFSARSTPARSSHLYAQYPTKPKKAVESAWPAKSVRRQSVYIAHTTAERGRVRVSDALS